MRAAIRRGRFGCRAWVVAAALAWSGCELVPGRQCSEGCPPEAPCDSTTGLCTVPAIRIVEPASEVVGRPVHIVAELRFRDPAQGPSSLGFQLVDSGGNGAGSGVLGRASGGQYVGSWSPAAQGTYELKVTGEGFESLPKSIRVDLKQPTLTATAPAPSRRAAGGLCGDRDPDTTYANAWRRDEVLDLAVSADEPLRTDSVKLLVMGVNGSVEGAAYGHLPVTFVPGGSCGSPYCGTVSVDLSKPEFRAFRGVMNLRLSGTDLAGNEGVGSGGINVTRWKWHCQLAKGGRAYAAIGTGGVVYVPATFGGDAGISAVTPGGVLAWHKALEGVAGGLAIAPGPDGREEIYANQVLPAEDAGYLLAVSTRDATTSIECGPYGQGMSDSIALLSWLYAPVTSPQTVPVTIVGEGRGSLLAAKLVPPRGCSLQPNVGMPRAGNSLSARSDTVYFSDSNPGLQTQAWTFTGSTWVQPATWPLVDLEMPSIAFAATALVGAGRTATDGGVFLVDLGGPGAGGVRLSTSASGAEAYHLALDGAGEAVFGDSAGALYRARPGFDPVAIAGDAGTYPAAPALGDDGRVYAVNSDGVLTAFQRSLSPEWGVPLGAPGASPPLLDCARDGGVPLAGRPGTVYVVTGAGELDAFVADSQAPDSTALWSRYRHDVGNTANRGWSLACP